MKATTKHTQEHYECVCGYNSVYPVIHNLSYRIMRKLGYYQRKQKDGTICFFLYIKVDTCSGEHYDEDSQ